MHITFLPSTFAAIASQTNLRLLPNAKSRTFSALKTQVSLVVALLFSAAFASSKVTTSIGSVAVCAFVHLANCAGDNTAG